MTRRPWLKISLATVTTALVAAAAITPAHADNGDKRRHALSLIGEPKYEPGFQHFNWVNPDAPKGGRLRQWALGTFDSLNPFSIKGSPATGLTLTHDSLMATSPDEPSTEYCLICEWVSYPDDFSSVTFKIRDGAKFSDGSAITAADVVFSLDALKDANPRFAFYYRNVTSAEETAPGEVTFRFDQKNNRELPQIVGQLYVFSKAFWTGNGPDGTPRSLKKATTEKPVSSGAYRIGDVTLGKSIAYKRVKDYWAKDLPVMRGQFNFDTLTWEYFRDATAAFEAFKSDQLDLWSANSAKQWAVDFNFKAIKSGEVKREAIPVLRVAGMQAFVLNIRRDKFKDPRVRRAFNLAYDFDWANRNLFYGQYTRLKSFFDNSELASSGLPTGRELEILETVRDKVPGEVFTTQWSNPAAASPTDARNNLREAFKLLRAAGWTRKGRVLTNAKGEPFEVEFLLVSPTFERVVLPYIESLKRLGIQASARVVDTSQYERRTETFDYDIIVDSFGQSFSPGNEQRNFWGSEAADKNGSENSIGVKDTAIDTLIERLIFAKGRKDLVAATRALDRVLLWNHFVVPQWHLPSARLAWWDRLGRPSQLARMTPAVLQTWWTKPGAAQ